MLALGAVRRSRLERHARLRGHAPPVVFPVAFEAARKAKQRGTASYSLTRRLYWGLGLSLSSSLAGHFLRLVVPALESFQCRPSILLDLAVGYHGSQQRVAQFRRLTYFRLPACGVFCRMHVAGRSLDQMRKLHSPTVGLRVVVSMPGLSSETDRGKKDICTLWYHGPPRSSHSVCSPLFLTMLCATAVRHCWHHLKRRSQSQQSHYGLRSQLPRCVLDLSSIA